MVPTKLKEAVETSRNYPLPQTNHNGQDNE